MIVVWRWIKKWWWTIVFGVVTVFGFLFWLLLPKQKNDSKDSEKLTFKEKAQTKIEYIKLEGEIEKARVKATADIHSQRLDKIEACGKYDPAEARRQLANWMAREF
jgi:hypothetical protein